MNLSWLEIGLILTLAIVLWRWWASAVKPANTNAAANAGSNEVKLSGADQAKDISQTFLKFVPRQFVDHFQCDDIQGLALGRADEDDVAIMFTDIRGFTSLSENMSPQEIMNFLNSYFIRMNEPIHANRGFIDKFIGDAILALFDHPGGSNRDKALDALKAAKDFRTAINLYNQHRKNSGYPPVNVGLGIHFGPVILGTVGCEDRMDTTVIGDAVNIAHRLEALSPNYQADIVVSAELLKTCGDKPPCIYRLLDFVRVKGRRQPVEIYELIDHQSEPLIAIKLATNELIKQGIEARKRHDWPAALNCFSEAEQRNPNDTLIQHHIQQVRLLMSQTVPKDWDGAIDLTPK